VKIWIDAQLSQSLASWLTSTFNVEAVPVRMLALRDADDPTIFAAARDANAVVMTKDRDFVDLLHRRGAPPQVLWITSDNTSNTHMREILSAALPQALDLLRGGADDHIRARFVGADFPVT
jgi:predicted nuclease of predicted toxin-antitoxin system